MKHKPFAEARRYWEYVIACIIYTCLTHDEVKTDKGLVWDSLEHSAQIVTVEQIKVCCGNGNMKSIWMQVSRLLRIESSVSG